MTQECITEHPTPGGGPAPQDARLPVCRVLALAAEGLPLDEIAAELPELRPADVKAALEYAGEVVRRRAEDEERQRPAPGGVDSAQEQVELDLSRVLVVDDREGSRRLLELLLQESGYAISLAAGGEEALARARDEHPFLVLSDVQMPGMDGLELCRRLKADEQTRDSAVVFITSHGRDAGQISAGLEMGADDYVSYPFEQEELLSRVRAVARLKRAEEEARRQARVVARRNKELELVNDLALAVSSTLDLKEVFSSSMQGLCQLLDAQAVSLLLLDQETQELLVNVSARDGQHVSVPVEFRTHQDTAAWEMRERVPIIVCDVLGNPDAGLEMTPPPAPHAIRSIPMIVQERIIGAVAIIGKRGGSFSAADWTLLYSAASVVAVAVENARLLQGVQQQVEDLVLLNEIGHMLTSTLDPEEILSNTTHLVQQLLQADVASLWLLDQDGETLMLTAVSGDDARLEAGSRLPASTGVFGQVVQTGEPHLHEPGSVLCVPLLVKNRIVGVVQALPQSPRWFNRNDLYLLDSIASSVGIAVENARLFGSLQDFNRRLEQMVEERTRELVEEKNKTEAILASMADGLLVLDAENHVLAMNAAAEQMLGSGLAELLGKPVGREQLAHPLWRCVVEMAAGDELIASASVDVPASDKADGLLSIQAHSARVRNGEGGIIGTVVLLRDITPIREVERIKARFMAGVTHELKTPLSVIRLRADNLQAYWDRLPGSRREELFDSIRAQTRVLERLVERILELSRLDSGIAETEWEAVELVELMDRLVGDMRPLADDKQIELDWTRPETEVVILATPGQMRQLVHNLIENAIKYTPENGSVRIAVGAEPVEGRTVARLRVSDTGIGIPPEHHARVFERFYRIDPSHNIPGTGLGLAIVKEIVEAFGGDISLESTAGEGSTFTVTMPALQGQAGYRPASLQIKETLDEEENHSGR